MRERLKMISKFQKISKRIIPMVFILLIMNPLIAQDKLAISKDIKKNNSNGIYTFDYESFDSTG